MNKNIKYFGLFAIYLGVNDLLFGVFFPQMLGLKNYGWNIYFFFSLFSSTQATTLQYITAVIIMRENTMMQQNLVNSII